MTSLNWPFCDINEPDPALLKKAYLDIYIEHYVNAEVCDWRGRRILFRRNTFDHAFSEATNYRTGNGIHDIKLSLDRARRIHWIKNALAGKDIKIEVHAQTRNDSRGRPKKRRAVIVLDNRYVVVLEAIEHEVCEFAFVTAFVADQAYLNKIRTGAQVVERLPPSR